MLRDTTQEVIHSRPRNRTVGVKVKIKNLSDSAGYRLNIIKNKLNNNTFDNIVSKRLSQ